MVTFVLDFKVRHSVQDPAVKVVLASDRVLFVINEQIMQNTPQQAALSKQFPKAPPVIRRQKKLQTPGHDKCLTTRPTTNEHCTKGPSISL